MLIKIKNSLILSLSIPFFIACGGGSSTDTQIVNQTTKASSITGLQQEEEKSKINTISDSAIAQTTTNASNIDVENANTLCDTGSISFSTKDNQTIDIDSVQCVSEGTTIDGTINLTLDKSPQNDLKSINVNVTRDIQIKDTEHALLLEKGANISVVNNGLQDATSYTLNTTFKSKINDVVFNVSNLEVTTISASCGFMGPLDDCIESESYTVTKGSFNIGENYFEIDETKENTIIVNELGYQNGGVVYMHDGAGHNVELRVENKALVLKIDENGDGEFSDNEILK